MDLLCQGFKSCGPCCSSDCKWVTFDNKTESCHQSVENLEDVLKMVDKVENCSAVPSDPEDGELIKDLSEIFGGLTGGFILALVFICCYVYFRLPEEQRQRLGRYAGLAFRAMEFVVRLCRGLNRRREDQAPLLADAENPAVRDPAAPQQLPALPGAGEGQDNLAGNLEDEDHVFPDHGLPFALVLMDPLPLHEVAIEDEGGEDEEDDNGEEAAVIGNGNPEQVIENEEGEEGQEEGGAALQQEQQNEEPLFVIGAGGPIDSSEDDDDEILPPPNRSSPRRNPTRHSKSSSIRKLAQLRRNRQI